MAAVLAAAGLAIRAPAAFVLAGPDGAAPVFVPPGEPECVRLAAEDLVSDVARITRRTATFAKNADAAGVVLASANRPESAAMLERLAPGFADGLAGQWEAYRVATVGPRLVIAGGDERGTMFGLYAFLEEKLGVDPLHFWTSRAPRPRERLEWDRVRIVSDGPAFRFRGWFINDEDLLTEWRESGGARRIDYPYYGQVVNRDVMRAVAGSLVRSRCNLIIPASFVDILNPPEAALLEECARRGVFLSQHHVEPMGVSAFAYFNYWKARGRDLKYSYFSHPAEVRKVWRVYAEKWAAFPNVIWQLGLRGIADRPMWMADPATPQSDADRGRLISDAMAEQVRILDEVAPGRPRVMSTTLWAEGSALNRQGLLTIPANTIVVFADNSPGWKWQEDFHTTPRDPRNAYGVYYHHGLIGSGPHLAQVPSPRKTHECLRTAMDKGAGTYAICNVGNIREFVLGIDATAKMTWRMEGFDPDAWLDGWARERFPARAAEVAAAYRAYFDAWAIHPEQKVPFLMDGQMFGAGNSVLGKLAKRLKDTTSKPAPAATNLPAAKTGDAFWAGLSDMHPRALDRPAMLRHLAAQRDGLSKAIQIASAAASALPDGEASFLRDNLIHQSAIMVRACLWLEQVEAAAEALDRGDRPGCASALAQAESSFAEIPRLSESYCSGPWENWYRGCRKLNIEAALKRTRDVLDQARGVPPPEKRPSPVDGRVANGPSVEDRTGHPGKANGWVHVEHVAKSGNRITAEVRKGTSANLILIPGTWGSADVRSRLVEALNPDLNLVCVALAGQDDNWPPPVEPSIPEFSQDILCLADKLGLDRFFVGGNSLGGMVAIDMLRICPERILGSIPIEGWTHWQASVSAFGGDTSSTLTAEQRSDIEQVRRKLLDRWDPALRSKYGAMWKKWDGWEALATTRVPVLEIWGDRGRARPSRETLRIPDRDNIRVEWIAGASHSLLVEAPEKLAGLINRFVMAGTASDAASPGTAAAARGVEDVTGMPGLVAFWDFVKREPDGARRFTAHVPAGAANDYALDAANYVKDYWGAGREATYDDFPLLGRGPFGQAIRIRKEADPDFRPFLFVPRARLHDTPLDIKGAGKSVTVVVWAIRESGNHALAGIWHEGTDLKQKETTGIARAVRGQRQYALFAGLNKGGSACGHVSENGASSFLNKYALHKCNSAGISREVPSDAPAEVLDASWQCFAMTFDDAKDELTGWLDGVAGDRWLESPHKDGLLSFAGNAWLQGRLHREPGLQPGEDPDFPKDQFYNPPEDAPVAVTVVSESANERVELREYRYTKVRVTLRAGKEIARDLVALRLNPWWYPHGIYRPADDGTGGPFTIGRVIHSSRGVGFTGWIGGVAVFDRALRAEELLRLAKLSRVP